MSSSTNPTDPEPEPSQHLHIPTTNLQAVPKLAKDKKPEPTTNPEPMPAESNQVCELAPMSCTVNQSPL